MTPAQQTLKKHTHRGFTLHFDLTPIPVRDFDWTALSPDYDASWEGEEDGWVEGGVKFHAATREGLIEQIDEYLDEEVDL